MSEERFGMMESRDLECRCGRKHCSPTCEACRVYGISRCLTSTQAAITRLGKTGR